MTAEFTLLDDNPVTVNMDQVDYFPPADDHTVIAFADGRALTADRGYNVVAEVLKPRAASRSLT